jgi:aryl-alcohol dehydrogenase-like predicted oxidoreductase
MSGLRPGLAEQATWGRTGKTVSRICFGCEQLGGTDWGQIDEAATSRAVQAAFALGVNCFDTAAVYGLGASERRLSEALGDDRHRATIATKVGYGWESGGGTRARTRLDGRPLALRNQIEESLRRLRLERISLCYLHRPDPAVPIERSIEVLEAARVAGQIEEVGCSNVSLEELRRVCAVARIAAVQLSLSLIDWRGSEDVLTYCHDRGIAVFAYGPLAQGLLTGKYTPGVEFPVTDRRHRLSAFRGEELEKNLAIGDRVAKVASERGRTGAQCAIRWVLDHPSVTCAVVGTKSLAQLEENLGALGWRLTQSEYSYLTTGQ